jgi:hypothetical protein
MSPAKPYKMSFFLPILSDNLPMMGEKMTKDKVKAEMKIPTDATEAPNEVIYIGKKDCGRKKARASTS